MKINRNNYEAFLIDYIDGTLDAEKLAELLLFLDEMVSTPIISLLDLIGMQTKDFDP